MEEKLDFSLPQKRSKNCSAKIIFVSVLIVVAVLAAVFLTKRTCVSKCKTYGNSGSLSNNEIKDLASKLAGRDLYARSAVVLQNYLAVTELSDYERAKMLFRIGTLLEKEGSYEEAVEYYYRSEMTAEVAELNQQINIHIKNCFQRLGKFSALRYELMDRTGFKKSDSKSDQIVAGIGAEKITESDLDALIERTVGNQLAPLKVFMTAQQVNSQKEKTLGQYKDPKAKMEFLQGWLIQELLYRKALQVGFSERPEVKIILEDVVRSVLSQQLMNKELAGKINVTDDDLETYYKANKGKYIEAADPNDPNSLPRQKSYDEVSRQLASELIGQKTRDIQQQMTKELMDKYDAVIHFSVWMPDLNDE